MKKTSVQRLLETLRRRRKERSSREVSFPRTAPQQVFTPYDQKRLRRQLADRLTVQQLVRERQERRTSRHRNAGPER